MYTHVPFSLSFTKDLGMLSNLIFLFYHAYFTIVSIVSPWFFKEIAPFKNSPLEGSNSINLCKKA